MYFYAYIFCYFLQIFDFLVTDIFLEQGKIHFFLLHLSTRTDLAINFDLVKCIPKKKKKKIATQNIKERWREDFHQKGKIKVSARCTSMVYSRDTEVSFLMSCSLKVTQNMHPPTSQLYSIWMFVLKVLHR